MTGTERKRCWRLRNPERSRTAERRRSQARRDGTCGSAASYRSYEQLPRRLKAKREREQVRRERAAHKELLALGGAR